MSDSDAPEPLARVRPRDHWYGLIVSFCVFVCQFGIYGATNSYSLFAHQLSNDESLGKPSETEVSFGNSIGNGLAPIISIFAGAITDRVGPRIMLMMASLLTAVGYFTASFAPSVTALIFMYSVPICIGSSCLSTPGGAAISSWLDKRINLGMGIAYSGNGAGSSVVVPIAGLLAANYDWRTSFKVIALFPLIGVIAGLFVVFRAKPTPGKPLSLEERLFIRRLLTNRAFITLFFSCVLFSYAFFSCLYLIVPYAASFGRPGSVYGSYTRIEVAKAATLFTFFGVFKWIGSLSLGGVAHKTEARLVYALSGGSLTVLVCVWVLCTTYVQLAIVASLMGFGFAGMFATLPAMTAKCFAGPYAGLAIGSTMSAFAVGGFAGPPSVLSLHAMMGKSYTASLVSISMALAASALTCFFGGFGVLVQQDFAKDPSILGARKESDVRKSLVEP